MSHNDDTNQLQWNKLSLGACMKGKCCARSLLFVSTGNTKTTAPPIALKTINKQQESASTPEHPDLHCAWTSQKWWSSAGFHHWSCSFTNTSNKSYLVADDTTELSLSRADITGLAWTWVPNNVAIDAVMPVPSVKVTGMWLLQTIDVDEEQMTRNNFAILWLSFSLNELLEHSSALCPPCLDDDVLLSNEEESPSPFLLT